MFLLAWFATRSLRARDQLQSREGSDWSKISTLPAPRTRVRRRAMREKSTRLCSALLFAISLISFTPRHHSTFLPVFPSRVVCSCTLFDSRQVFVVVARSRVPACDDGSASTSATAAAAVASSDVCESVCRLVHRGHGARGRAHCSVALGAAVRARSCGAAMYARWRRRQPAARALGLVVRRRLSAAAARQCAGECVRRRGTRRGAGRLARGAVAGARRVARAARGTAGRWHGSGARRLERPDVAQQRAARDRAARGSALRGRRVQHGPRPRVPPVARERHRRHAAEAQVQDVRAPRGHHGDASPGSRLLDHGVRAVVQAQALRVPPCRVAVRRAAAVADRWRRASGPHAAGGDARQCRQRPVCALAYATARRQRQHALHTRGRALPAAACRSHERPLQASLVRAPARVHAQGHRGPVVCRMAVPIDRAAALGFRAATTATATATARGGATTRRQ